MCECDHKFNFCESCLHHYVIYKVNNFEEVHCPHEGCPATIDIATTFFNNLPADIQRKYKKIHQFYQVSNDPDLRLCPQDKCEGTIRKTIEGAMKCSECSR